MTKPRPRAPPVTTAVLPSSENEAKVLLAWMPPLPCTGTEGGRSFSSGYSTTMSWFVRANWPSWSPLSPGSLDVDAALWSASLELFSGRLSEDVKGRIEEIAGCAGRKAWALAARATCRIICGLNMAEGRNEIAIEGEAAGSLRANVRCMRRNVGTEKYEK